MLCHVTVAICVSMLGVGRKRRLLSGKKSSSRSRHSMSALFHVWRDYLNLIGDCNSGRVVFVIGLFSWGRIFS